MKTNPHGAHVAEIEDRIDMPQSEPKNERAPRDTFKNRLDDPALLRGRHARMSAEWAVRLQNEPGALAVAIILSSHANTRKGDDGKYYRVAWPSSAKIAERLGVTERAVDRHIQRLIGIGFIRETTRRRRETAHRKLWDYIPGKRDAEKSNEEPF